MKKEEVAKNITLRQQPFATPEKVRDVVTEAYRNVKTKLPAVHRSMSLYLANRETESILFKPIKVFKYFLFWFTITLDLFLAM